MTTIDIPVPVLASGDPVFTRGDALAHGLNDRDLARLVRSRVIVRVRRGAYCSADLWARSGPVDRYRLVCRAVARALEGRAILSHTSAAAYWGLDLWDADLRTVHVTRIDGTTNCREAGVVHHSSAPELKVEQRHGLPVQSLARTVIEHSAWTSIESGLVAADSALRAGLLNGQALRETYEEVRHWPRMRHTDLVVRMANGLSGSAGETRCRYLFWHEGIPAPTLQYRVHDVHGTLVGTADFGWEKYGLLGEFDGRIKYGELVPAGESASDVVVREKIREDLMREASRWPMVRVTWGDLDRRKQTGDRVRAQLYRPR